MPQESTAVHRQPRRALTEPEHRDGPAVREAKRKEIRTLPQRTRHTRRRQSSQDGREVSGTPHRAGGRALGQPSAGKSLDRRQEYSARDEPAPEAVFGFDPVRVALVRRPAEDHYVDSAASPHGNTAGKAEPVPRATPQPIWRDPQGRKPLPARGVKPA